MYHMIVLVRKSNAAMLALIFLLSLGIYWLNAEDLRDRETSAQTDGQRCIVLDPGHGGEDPGAVSQHSGNKEKVINLEIANYLREIFEGKGYRVIMTRTEDVLQYGKTASSLLQKRKDDLTRRKKIMDESGADIVISIHMNKFPEEKYWGIQSFFPPDSPDSERLAAFIQENVRTLLQPESTRQALVNDRGIIILKQLKTPTAIVECGFLSNKDEDARLTQPDYRRQIAEAIAAGVEQYFAGKQ